MTFPMKVVYIPFLLSVAACFIGANRAQSQRSVASSSFGASASTSASTAGKEVAARRADSGGYPSWDAGKGSFGYSAQHGGVWCDGTTLDTATGTAHITPIPPIAPADALSLSSSIAPASSYAKLFAPHRNAGFGASHLSHSSSNQPSRGGTAGPASAARSLGLKYAVVGTHGRIAVPGKSFGNGKTRPSSSFASNMTHTSGKEPEARLHQHNGLDTQLFQHGSR
jgi:hypothetical protein